MELQLATFGTHLAFTSRQREMHVLKRTQIHFAAITVVVLLVSVHSSAQANDAQQLKPGTIVGTVVDVNGDTVPGATVVLKQLDSNNGQTLVTSGNGFFAFQDLNPRISYRISISANDFA